MRGERGRNKQTPARFTAPYLVVCCSSLRVASATASSSGEGGPWTIASSAPGSMRVLPRAGHSGHAVPTSRQGKADRAVVVEECVGLAARALCEVPRIGAAEPAERRKTERAHLANGRAAIRLALVPEQWGSSARVGETGGASCLGRPEAIRGALDLQAVTIVVHSLHRDLPSPRTPAV